MGPGEKVSELQSLFLDFHSHKGLCELGGLGEVLTIEKAVRDPKRKHCTKREVGRSKAREGECLSKVQCAADMGDHTDHGPIRESWGVKRKRLHV